MTSAPTPEVARPRRWRRRLLLLGALLLLMRLVLGYGLDPILRSALGAAGMNADWESLQLNLLDGRVEVRAFTLSPAPEPGGEGNAQARPLVSAATLVLDADARALLGGHLRVERLVLEGARVHLDRAGEGGWNFAPLMGSAAPKEPSTPGPLLLDLPLEVLEARVQDLRVSVRDLQAVPPLDVSSTTSLTLTGVGVEGESAALDLRVVSAECLDLLRVRGAGTLDSAGVDLTLELTLAGLRPEPLAGLLLDAGLDARAATLHADSRLRLQVNPLQSGPNQVQGRVTLDRTEVRADETVALGLEQIEVRVDAFGEGALQVGSVLMDGLVAEAALESDGTLTFAGLGPAPAGAAIAPTPAADKGGRSASPSSAGAAPSPPSPLKWSLARAELKDCELAFTDRALGQGHRISAHLDSIAAGPVSSEEGAPPSSLRFSATLPGIAEQVELNGTIDSILPRFKGSGQVKISGVAPDELVPYLALANIAPAFESGTFQVDQIDVDGLDFAARGLRVTDAGAELAAFDVAQVNVGGDERFRLELGGARGRVRRRLDDSIESVGLRFNVASDTAARPSAAGAATDGSEAAAGASQPFVVPKAWMPSLDLQFERLELISDRRATDPVTIGPISVTAGRAEGAAPGDARFLATANGKIRVAREFSASVELDGTEEGLLSLRGETAARGVNLEPLQEWIEWLGLVPAFEDGTVEAKFDLGLRAVDGQPEVSVEVGPLRIEDRVGAEVKEWLDLKELRVDGVRAGGEVTAAIKSLTIKDPKVRLERDEAGAWTALGMRLLPPTKGTEDAAAPTPQSGTPASPASTGWLSLAQGSLDGATVTVVEEAGGAASPLVLEASVSVQDLAPGTGAPPATVSAELGLEGTQWAATGSVHPDPQAPSLDLSLTVDRLAEASLQGFLPHGVGLHLTDGVGRARVSGRWGPSSQGGDSLAFEVADLDLRQRGAERPALGASLLRVTAPRLDPEAGVIDVEDVTVEALAIELVRLEDGGVRVASVDLHPTADGDAGQADDTAAPPSPRRRLRSVRLGALDLGLKEVRLTTEGAEVAPFVASSRIKLKDSVQFDSEDFLEDAPPIELEITGKAEPGQASLTVDLSASPFDSEPEVDGRIQIDSLDGAFIRSVFPELRMGDGDEEFDDGKFSASVHSELRWRRSGPLDFDLRNGFGLDFRLEDLELRRTSDGPVALGLDLLALDASSIAPRAGRYQVRRLEIENPRVRVRRGKDGVDVAGFLVLPNAVEAPTPEPDPLPSDAAGEPESKEAGDRLARDEAAGSAEGRGELAAAGTAVEGAPEAPATENATAPQARRSAPKFNLTVDDILFRDADLLFEDETVTPVLSIPLVALDAEVRGLSSRMLSEPRPLRFSLSLGGGNVSLPVRLKQTSLIRGVAVGVAGAVSSRKEEVVQYEDRPLFAELVTSGQLSFFPSTTGWFQGSLQGFELTALRGAAIASGVEVGDGVLDFSSRTRLSGRRGGHMDSTVSLSYLSLSEPDGGPISRFLKLPAPLDTVIFVLKNEQGEIRLPLSFDFGGTSSMGVAEFSAKASAAFLRLVTEALAAAPLRAVGSVTDVVGLGGLMGGRDRTPKYAGMTAGVDFEVGSAHMDRELSPPLKAIVKAMAKDPLLELEGVHHFGEDDLERARVLANPDSDVAVKLLQSLRTERDVLARQRGDLAAAARSHLRLGRTKAFAEAQASLLRVSRELGEIESRVDQVAGLLVRNAASKLDRRRKRVALELAQARLNGMMRALIRAGVDQERVNLKRPRYKMPESEDRSSESRIQLLTRAGTPRKGFFSRVLSVFSF